MTSRRTWGGWYAVGVVAAVIAVIECSAVVVLINRDSVIEALGLPGWVPPVATAVAVVLAAMVAIAAAVGAVPNRHRIES